MYTQCPSCNTTFQITAAVLKKAAGQVRCGGCNVAFNALDFLSEDVPTSAAPTPANAPEPELRPETDDMGSKSLPKKISARRSAALMKTLDELAGSDIQIEDTGVEWRVLDDDILDDEPDLEEEAAAESQLNALTGSMKIAAGDDDDESGDDLAEQSSTSNVMRFDDDTPLPDDFDADDSTPATAEEPVSANESPAHASGFEDPATDLTLGEPDEWEQLLDEVDESAIQNLDTIDEVSEEAAESEVESTNETPDTIAPASVAGAAAEIPPDVDTQFEIQAAEMGIDLSGMHKSHEIDGNGDNQEFGVERRTETAGTGIEEVLKRIANLDQKLDVQLDDQTDSHVDFQIDDESAAEIEVIGAEDIFSEVDEVESDAGIEVVGTEDQFSEDEEIELALLEESEDDDGPETSIDDDLIAAAFESEERSQESSASDGIPLLTEEEKTINMMIDEDFMRHAAESGNMFSPSVSSDRVEEKNSPLFETIVMEGESVRTALENEALAADAAAGLKRFDDAAEISGREGDGDYDRSDESWPASRRAIGGVVALALLLIGQVLHQSRDALATIPAFNNAVGPIYRLAGNPLTPNWDITGWRFEVSKGSSDENDAVLTIYSRIGNTSDSALPYPLVHVSLTDRYEEVVGSKVLEPAEYLGGDPNSQRPVAPGTTFNATVSIESPPRDATGFKLNVCYRLANGQLRCAIEDFK